VLLPFIPKLYFSFKIFHPKPNKSRDPVSNQARRQIVDSHRNIDKIIESLDNNLIEMAQDPDTIFKALRLVPEFDGNPNILTRFINICDHVVAQYLRTDPGSELSNLCLLNGILNKISGNAASTINSNGIPDNWLGIRTALINNFSDQRDETALYSDLSLATQGSKTPQEFYDQCQTLFSTIMTYVTLHENIPTTVEAKRALYKKVAMQAFVRGLKEPLGSRIRCMRPPTIEKALEYVQEELNVIYLQNRSDFPKAPHSLKASMPVQNVGFTASRPHNIQMPSPNWPAPMAQRGYQPSPQPFKFNMNQNHHHQQRMGPSRTQQMFRALPPNYNPQSNVFRMPPRNNPPINSGPKPMSGVQHFTPRVLPHTTMSGHDWRKSGNPPPNNYFKAREMNMNECMPYDNFYSTDDYYYEPDYYYYPEESYYNDHNSYIDFNYNNGDENQLNDMTDSSEPQPGPSNSSQDFQLDQILKKPK
jgi:hypothetical protein